MARRRLPRGTKITVTPRTRMTRDNTAVLLIDHQIGLFTGVRDIGVAELKHNVVGLAKAAQEDGYQPVVALDACGTFSRHEREAGLARLTALGIEVSDYATLIVEIMADNADPRANNVYAAPDMPFATLMGQVATGFAT
jgi:hypothetical protein